MARSNNKSFIIIILLVTAALAAYAYISSSDKPGTVQEVEVSNDLLEVKHPDGLENVMLEYEGFYVAFNPSMHQPNYSAWELTPDKTDGPFSRDDADFQADENVEGCATLQDYKRSGFTRGHIVPAADMKWSEKAMNDCHYLTNICPQDQRLNSGAWATVEMNCRKWVNKYGTLYIVSGPVLSDRLAREIGSTPVPIPERFFKVIVAPEANPPMGIAFIMPNGYVKGGAQQTVVTIDQVEAVTGFDFFAALPDEIENNVESQHSMAAWNH